MHLSQIRTWIVLACGIVVAALSSNASAATLCVNPSGAHGCYSTIQAAVNVASAHDVIRVAPGTYHEGVTIVTSLSLVGWSDDDATVIDATGMPNGILVDGFNHPGLSDVTISGFTVKNALYEGVLLVSVSDVTVVNNRIVENDKFGGNFTGAPTGCPGQPAYETDETGDCGGGLHLIGTSNSTVSGNIIRDNADGVLISDETAESHDNLLFGNVVTHNPEECGIVMASHPPVGATPPAFAPHYGVNHNTITENLSTYNGVKVGGAGVGMFSDGAGQGSVSNNVISHNRLIGNGLGGVALHTHVGPAFGLPADLMNGNHIVGNYIAANLADGGDTATPGRVGININSGGGGSPVIGTVIAENTIFDEDVDIAVNTPAEVDIHMNNLLGHKTGVADVCAYDHASICTGTIDASEDYWGCPHGPGAPACTTVSGSNIRYTPWLTRRTGFDFDK